MDCIAQKDNDRALALLEELPKYYKDTQSIYYELAYEKAELCMNSGIDWEAIKWFKKLPMDYKNTSSLYHYCVQREQSSRVNIAFETEDELKPSKGHVHNWVEIPGTRVYEIDRSDFSYETFKERCSGCGAVRTSKFSHHWEDA